MRSRFVHISLSDTAEEDGDPFYHLLASFALLFIPKSMVILLLKRLALGGRYNFPGLLYLPLCVLTFYKLYKELLIELRRKMTVDIAMKAALCLGLVGAIWLNGGYGENIRLIESKVAETKVFTARLENVMSILSTNEESPLVVESGDVWDYEKIFSYPRFLTAFKIANPFYLRVDGYSSETFNSDRSRKLAAKVEEVSRYGDEFYFPLGQLDLKSELCFSLFLSIRYPTTCRSLD